MDIQKIVVGFVLLVMGCGLAHAGKDKPTKFSDTGGVSNTRHNMTQSTAGTGVSVSAQMNSSRINYEEVCVYCHTPHGANTTAGAFPLWNRTLKATTYTTYSQLGTSTLTQPVSQPGANSLMCLSCHDGQTAIDSIINMPGSGRYQASQETSTDPNFFLQWPGTDPDMEHMGMSSGGLPGTGCLSCHVPGTNALATDFRAFVIGTDLTNDHPIGIVYPAPSGAVAADFNTMQGVKGYSFFFDVDGDAVMDNKELRAYGYTAGAAKVECASCHDPHGIPSGGPKNIPSFLRVPNTGSALCLTCHIK